MKRQAVRLATISMLGLALGMPSAFAQKKYDPGATDSEIKIGNIIPYSGPASAYGLIGKTIAAYFNKVQCFCFNSQPLRGGQSADLGVTFFVDPALATDPLTKDVQSITLSYTFYPAKPDAKTAAAATAPQQQRTQ